MSASWYGSDADASVCHDFKSDELVGTAHTQTNDLIFKVEKM